MRNQLSDFAVDPQQLTLLCGLSPTPRLWACLGINLQDGRALLLLLPSLDVGLILAVSLLGSGEAELICVRC